MKWKDELKGREPVIYARVSTKEQKGTLKTQVAGITKWLADNKITRKPVIFQEQISGTTKEPAKWLEAVEYAISKPNKTFLIVRDFQRISRNWRYGGKNMIDLYENEIPVISVIRNTMSATDKNPTDDDWLIGLYMALGAQEVDQLKKRTKKGLAEARNQGILKGTNKDFYSKEILNPYRELVRLLEAGVGQTEGATKTGRSSSWWRKNRDFLNMVRMRGGDKLLETWLDVSDKIRKIEQDLRFGKTKVEKDKIRAVRRKTSGFVQEPFNFPIPTDEMLSEYLENYKDYLPKRTK